MDLELAQILGLVLSCYWQLFTSACSEKESVVRCNMVVFTISLKTVFALVFIIGLAITVVILNHMK